MKIENDIPLLQKIVIVRIDLFQKDLVMKDLVDTVELQMPLITYTSKVWIDCLFKNDWNYVFSKDCIYDTSKTILVVLRRRKKWLEINGNSR